MARNDLARLKVVLEAESSRLSGELEKVNKRLGGFERQVNRRAASIGRAFQGILGAGLGAGAGASIVAGLSRATDEAASFEAEFSKVQAVTQATSGEIESLERIARQLGANTVFSAQEAAQGITFLGQAGFDTSQILKALPSTLDLATAGGIRLARAADIASNVLSGFGLEADQTQQVVDVLATAASKSNTNIEQLAQAFRTVAPVASALNISIESTASAIGTLGNAGLQAEIAGTGLRTVLASLAAPTKAASEALEELGLTADDVNPEVNDLEEVVKKLVDAGLDAESAFAIFGREGAAAILALTSQSEELEKLRRTMDDVEGAARDMARTMGDNLRGDVAGLQSSVSELALTFADRTGLLGGLRAVTQELTSFNRGLATAISGTGSSIDELRSKIADLRNVANEFGPLGIRGGSLTAGVREGLISNAETQLLDQLRAQTDAEGVRTNIQLLDKEIASAQDKIREFEDQIAAIPNDAPTQALTIGRTVVEAPFEILNRKLASATTELQRLTQDRSAAIDQLADIELKIDASDVSLPEIELPKPKIKPFKVNIPKGSFDGLQAEADRLAEQLQTPIEAFRNATSRFDELREADKISAELHSRAVQNATAELFDAYQEQGPQQAFETVVSELNRLRDQDKASFDSYADSIVTAQDRFSEAISDSDLELKAFGESLTRAQNPAIELAESLQRIDAAFGKGFVDAETRLKAITEESERFKSSISEAKEEVNDFGESAFEKLTSSLEDALLKMDDFRSITQGLAQDLAKLAIREFLTEPLEDAAGSFFKSIGGGGGGGAGRGVGNIFKSLFSFLPGFATGTDFTVGPQTSPSIPGADNRVFMARLQDGERVTVTPRGQSPSQNISVSMTVVARDVDSFASRESQTQAAAAARRMVDLGFRNQ